MATLGERLQAWRSLFEGMKLHPEVAAALEQEQAQLGSYLEEIGDLMHQADKHEAGLREANRRRLEVEALAAELHGRIVFILRGRYGKRNPLLHGFGIQPHAERGSRKRGARRGGAAGRTIGLSRDTSPMARDGVTALPDRGPQTARRLQEVVERLRQPERRWTLEELERGLDLEEGDRAASA